MPSLKEERIFKKPTKFWKIQRYPYGREIHVKRTWGKLNTAGQETINIYSTVWPAWDFMLEQCAAKLKRGYIEVKSLDQDLVTTIPKPAKKVTKPRKPRQPKVVEEQPPVTRKRRIIIE